ncbi:TPA: phosphoenolpyruvate carboxylase [Candidatus Bathyarchaeota archaeon]|nr:phosphoenolpyruvate carboxylase [Candidatus Bathyarchaeota archaeon]
MERIPALMATQHPDCASRFVSVEDEIEEAIVSVTPIGMGGFGCDEVMIDYEGKLTPYHQPKWVVERALKKGLRPGKSFLITPRIPHAGLEGIDRQVFIIISALSTNAYIQLLASPIRYVIHPMTAQTSDLIDVRRRLLKLQKFANEEMGLRPLPEISIIPLFEDVVKMLHVREIMEGYRGAMIKELGLYEDLFRVFIGKSDTALSYGHMASVLALKYALSELGSWAEEMNLHVFPIIGVGRLPFRGYLSPENVGSFVREYRGFYTVTIQSGIRYDARAEDAARVVRLLKEKRGGRPTVFDEDMKRLVTRLIRIFAETYLEAILPIAETICSISDAVPGRRARMERGAYHREIEWSISFLGDPQLSRLAREIALPRAIKFVASLYTMGIPPSIVGLGRGLRAVRERMGDEAYEVLLSMYPSIVNDVRFDLQYLDLELARSYAGDVWDLLRQDVDAVEEMLGVRAEETDVSSSNSRILREIRKRLGSPEAEPLILEAGRLRGSLG